MGRDYLIQFADVEIFCDGNKTIGLGHIRRSAALCKNLIDSGISARLTGISATASSLISGQEYRGGSSKIVIFDVFEGIEDRILQAKNDHKICTNILNIYVKIYNYQSYHFNSGSHSTIFLPPVANIQCVGENLTKYTFSICDFN
jgi:spore coat polysaccharide biosynthesis predicted glycosyltransferase SpsG